ncbi:hypothetical protein ACFWNE_16975 [Streptomyces goshikiensis]
MKLSVATTKTTTLRRTKASSLASPATVLARWQQLVRDRRALLGVAG